MTGFPVSSGELVDTTWLNARGGLLWDSVAAGVSLPAASITTPTLPTGFKHLALVYNGTSAAASTDDLNVRFNGDSGAHYNWQYILGSTAAVAASHQENAASGRAAELGQAGGYGGGGMIIIPRYNDAISKTWASYSIGVTSAPVIQAYTYGGIWQTAAAVTSITLLTSSGSNIATGRFSLYGLA